MGTPDPAPSSTSTPTSARRSPTTRRCSRWSPRPTSRAATTPATPRSCARSARGRPSAGSGSVRRCPTSTARGSAAGPRRAAGRADRAGRRPGGPPRATPRARRVSRCPTSSRTARSTTASSTTRSRPRAVLAGSGTLPVLGLPGGRLLRLARRGGPRDVRGGVPDRGYRPDAGTASRGCCRAPSRARCSTTPTRSPGRRCDLAARGWTRSACTATAPTAVGRRAPGAGGARGRRLRRWGVRVRWLPAGPRRAAARGRPSAAEVAAV